MALQRVLIRAGLQRGLKSCTYLSAVSSLCFNTKFMSQRSWREPSATVNLPASRFVQAAQYSCAAAPHSKTATSDGIYRMLELDREGKRLTVNWKDGTQSHFHSIWLRHNCHCGHCRQEHSGQRLLDPATIPYNVCIDDASMSGEQILIQWTGEDGGHTGWVPLSYLQENCYASDSLQIRREAVRIGTPAKVLPQTHYNELIQTSDGVLRWLRQLNESGVSILRGVPTEEHMVKKVAEYTGPVDDLIYGETFDVISTPVPINVAYSNVALDFHMDLIYYESPPGLQFLHCLRFDSCVEGGESRFLDVFHVAEQFREQFPKQFDTLTRIPATFQKIHYARDFPVEMKYQRPHIVLNQYKEIVAVNWAPAFEGPLAVEEGNVEPYYAAYQAFASAIKNSPDIVEYRLEPGDLVTFNNRRILHARNSFELNGGVRHLKGCYVNIDHFKSQVQVFSRLHGQGQPAKRVGNQDWF